MNDTDYIQVYHWIRFPKHVLPMLLPLGQATGQGKVHVCLVLLARLKTLLLTLLGLERQELRGTYSGAC